MQHKVSVSINPSILSTFDCGLTTQRLRTHDPATADSRPRDCWLTPPRLLTHDPATADSHPRDCWLTTLRLLTHDPKPADFVHKTTHSWPRDCIITLVRVVIIHVFLYAKNALKNVKLPWKHPICLVFYRLKCGKPRSNHRFQPLFQALSNFLEQKHHTRITDVFVLKTSWLY